jgi:hypothetical protein
LAIVERKKSWHRRLLTLICPSIAILTFAIWRTTQALQPDSTAGYTVKNPTLGRLINDYFTGFKVLVYGWTEPIKQLFGFNKNILPLILIIILIFAIWFGFMIIMRWKGSKEENTIALGSIKKHDLYPILTLFLIGVVFTIAGFFPVIVLFMPNLSSMLSRVNFMAIPGATLIIVAGLNAGALILSSNSRRIEILVGLASIPLVILGMMTQIWVQKETQTAWVEQKKIWSDLIALAPNLTEDTTIYFVLPGYQDRVGFANWRRIPLQGDWDTDAALHVLYNNQTLQGDVIYPDIQTPVEPALSEKGVLHYWEGRLTPYDRTVFVIYDGYPKRLRIIEDPVKELNMTWSIPLYSPEKRILVKRNIENRYRQFVGE